MNLTTILVIIAIAIIVIVGSLLLLFVNKIHRRSFVTDDFEPQPQPYNADAPLCTDCLYIDLPMYHQPCKTCLPNNKHLFKPRTPVPAITPEPETPAILEGWNPQPRVCKYCDKTYLPKWPRQLKFCSAECAKAHKLLKLARKKFKQTEPASITRNQGS